MTSKPTVRGKGTIDWTKLKVEFLKGPWLEVAPFLRDKLDPAKANTGYYRKRTRRWGEEKQAMKERILQKVEAQVEDEKENELKKALENIRTELVRRTQPNESIDVQVRDLNVLWNMLRVENGMPTTIAKNENRNHDDTALEKQALEDLLNKAKDANASGQSNSANQS